MQIDFTKGADIDWSQPPVIPPGVYLLEVVGFNFQLDRKSIGIQLEVVDVVEIAASEDPEKVLGRRVWDNIRWSSEAAISRSGHMMRCLGLSSEEIANFNTDEAEDLLLGRQGIARVTQRVFNDQLRNSLFWQELK